MSIISVKFILFAAGLTAIYFLLPKKCQWVVLLAASAVFYLSGGWEGCCYILVTIVTQYLLALALDRENGRMAGELAAGELDAKQKKAIKRRFAGKKRRYLVLSVIVNLGILCAVKYTDPAIETLNSVFGTGIGRVDILVPMGLSYYTFKSIGYVIDVYRGRIRAQRNIGKLALYVGYFPALVQGPIDRYEDVAEQLYAEHSFSYERLCFGAQRMLWGYIKKLVIAERAMVIVDQVIGNYASAGYEGFTLFFGVVLYAVQIYADFSGGMDIVLGLSEIFGIRLTENFRRPFFATSVAEYWQRWHITLGAWMRTYVFYPLSLSQAFNKLGKKCRKVFGDQTGKLIAPSLASFITFVLIGIWHGVGWKYVIYGFYMAVFVSSGTLLEDVYAKARERLHISEQSKGWRVFQSVRTVFIISMSRYVNKAQDVPDMFRMMKATFTHFNPWVFFDGTFYTLGLDKQDFWLLMLAIVVLFCVDLAQERGVRIRAAIARENVIIRWGVYYAAIFALLIFGMYGPGYNAAGFIYQRF